MNKNERNIQLIKDKDYETLLQENGGLVKNIVFKRFGGNWEEYDMDDMVALGMYALYKAALKFDPDKGTNFSTYAGTAILNEILIYIRNNTNTIKPVSIELPIYSGNSDNELTIKDTVSDNNIYNDINYNIKTNNFYKLVNYARINLLTKREKEVFDAYNSDKKQREIADELGCTQASVSRIYRKACDKIKNYLLTEGVDQYYFNN